MKTGIEMIADKRADICVREPALKIPLSVSILWWADEHIADGKYDHAIRCLAEAGAMIAAEIDRINNLKQE